MENFKFYYKSLYSFFLESRGISETWEAWEQLTIEHFEAVNSTPVGVTVDPGYNNGAVCATNKRPKPGEEYKTVRNCQMEILDEDISGTARDNMVLLDIYFEDLHYTSVTESEADNTSSLVSDLGGQLGLFLGMSVLTLVELFYCCFCLVPKTSFVLAKSKMKNKDGTVHQSV